MKLHDICTIPPFVRLSVCQFVSLSVCLPVTHELVKTWLMVEIVLLATEGICKPHCRLGS